MTRRVGSVSTLPQTSTYSLTCSSLQADVLGAVLRRRVAEVRVAGGQGLRASSAIAPEVEERLWRQVRSHCHLSLPLLTLYYSYSGLD